MFIAYLHYTVGYILISQKLQDRIFRGKNAFKHVLFLYLFCFVFAQWVKLKFDIIEGNPMNKQEKACSVRYSLYLLLEESI